MLEELYRLTPMEETFGINNVALVDGQPRMLGLRELLAGLRRPPHRRRPPSHAYRRRKREERLHLVEGLLIALLDIDEVIRVIRPCDDSAGAGAPDEVFHLSEIQANYILDTPLRRLTRYDKLELDRERDQLHAEIAELTAILASETGSARSSPTSSPRVAKSFGTPRRTVLLEATGAPHRDRAAGGRRRPLPGAVLVHRAARPDPLSLPDATGTTLVRPSPPSVAGQGDARPTTWWYPACPPPSGARSAWSPRTAG